MAKGKGRRGSKRIAKKTQKMMTGSCMFGGNSAHYSGSGSGATEYGAAIFGDRGSQVADGMGGNHIKMNDPAVAWKGGQRGGGEMPIQIPVGATDVKISWTDPPADATGATTGATSGGSRGGNMFGAAIVPAALLAANQLYKPTRAINNLSFSRKKGFRKTMKKMMAKRRR
jgi:hypothetical protein